MSAQDEDDEFFADIYGDANKQTSQPKPAATGSSDPRAALLSRTNQSQPQASAQTSTSAPAPQAASAPTPTQQNSHPQPQPQPQGQTQTQAAAPAPAPSAPAPSAPAPTSQQPTSQQPAQQPASTPFSAAAANANASASNAPAPASNAPAQTPSAPAGQQNGAFNPDMFMKQLQQLQQLQQSGADKQTMANEVKKLQGHTDQGFHAGNIFIPAKDEGKMFIGGLNWETTDESMKNYFNQFGKVLEVNVMRDPNTGRSRGFGFLTFESAHSVTEVLKREHFLDGKIIDPKRAIPREEQDKTAKIFVGGVGMDVTEEDFKNFFEQFGTVIDAQLMIDKDTGRPRGFGFVTFDDHNAVDTIVAEKFLDLKGKAIEVKRAEPRLSKEWQNRNAQQMRQNTAGYYPNAMDPSVMSQYYQQWQTYMAQFQEMMKNGQGGAMPTMPNMMPGMQGMPNMMPGMPGMQGMPNAQPAGQSQEPQAESADPRRSLAQSAGERRRGDERRRSRSPPRDRRRRDFARDPRDRNARR